MPVTPEVGSMKIIVSEPHLTRHTRETAHPQSRVASAKIYNHDDMLNKILVGSCKGILE